MARTRTDRRAFLGVAAGFTATAMSASSYAQVRGANDRIRIGVIGCGRRGFGAHIRAVDRHAELENLQISAVCDVWSAYRQRAADHVKQRYARTPLSTADYRSVLDRKEVDAVMIASCDFQHPQMLTDACLAGKDAYCEKPVSMEMRALKAARQAVLESKAIVQIGTQRRSEASIKGAQKLIADGTLGKLSRIEFFRNAARPNWYKRLTRLPIEATEVAWDQFLMHLPTRPFSDVQFAGWYGYREFCGGSFGQFLSHYADLTNFLTGSAFPSSAVAQGGTFVWDDRYNFDCRDQVQVSLIYPEDFLLTYSTNFGNGSGSRSVMYGSNGVLDLSGSPVFRPDGSNGDTARERRPEVESIAGPDHFLDWFQCMRNRKQPIAPIEAGYQHSVACIMADQAMQTGKRQIYDHASEEVRPG